VKVKKAKNYSGLKIMGGTQKFLGRLKKIFGGSPEPPSSNN